MCLFICHQSVRQNYFDSLKTLSIWIHVSSTSWLKLRDFRPRDWNLFSCDVKHRHCIPALQKTSWMLQSSCFPVKHGDKETCLTTLFSLVQISQELRRSLIERPILALLLIPNIWSLSQMGPDRHRRRYQPKCVDSVRSVIVWSLLLRAIWTQLLTARWWIRDIIQSFLFVPKHYINKQWLWRRRRRKNWRLPISGLVTWFCSG